MFSYRLSNCTKPGTRNEKKYHWKAKLHPDRVVEPIPILQLERLWKNVGGWLTTGEVVQPPVPTRTIAYRLAVPTSNGPDTLPEPAPSWGTLGLTFGQCNPFDSLCQPMIWHNAQFYTLNWVNFVHPPYLWVLYTYPPIYRRVSPTSWIAYELYAVFS